MTRQYILERAMEKWGCQAQTDHAIEEMGELIVAINHHRRGRVKIDAVQEEIADVKIALDQLAMIYGESGVAAFEEAKLNRLEDRVNEKERKRHGNEKRK